MKHSKSFGIWNYTVLSLLLVLFTFHFLHFTSQPVAAGERLKMSTTTSTDNSGLLKVLLPPFEKQNNIRIDVIPVGTGKALKLGENGDVDVVLVHAKKAELKFVKDGYGVDRREIMYNQFQIIGPKSDPAGIKGMKDAAKAFKKIAKKKAIFVSRGDDSGTHKKEKQIWEKSGVKPEGKWYLESGQGMGITIQIADEKMGYTLTDSATYLAYEEKVDLEVLAEGDPILFNLYGIMAVNPKKHPHVKYDMAKKFIDWISGPEAKEIIGNFKIKGKVLFTPID